MIELSNITYPPKNPVLKEISLNFNEGEITGIIGRAGSGKSTLLSLLSLDEKIPDGIKKMIRFKNEPASALSRKETAGLVMRADTMPENMDELLGNFLLLSRIPHKKFLDPFKEYDFNIVNSFMERFALAPFREYALNRLTAGFFKRTLLAFSFIREAKIMLFDNPTGGLDLHGTKILYKEMVKSVMDGRRSIIIASHDINFIAETADRIIILDDGKIAEDIPPDKLNTQILKKYLEVETIISKNMYNGRPIVHLFPGS